MLFKFSMTILTLVALGTDAYAYLDPGTGSIVVQSIVAGVASSLFVIKLYWHKLRAALGLGPRDTKAKDGADRA